MSMAKQGSEDAPSVNLILQNLTKRPNVRSTLILSRKDGSIIKVSGSIAEDTPAQVQSGTRENAAQDQEESVKLEEPKLTRAQAMASSIYAFVAAAAVLGESVRSIDTENSSIAGRPGGVDNVQAGSGTDSNSKSQAEDDVQLLRLRLKRQEVIIFPDPNYLCCVVQDLEKGPR
ncbi:hypothetical protein OHC33_004095 [Knufia fluminis]|uniref:Uncharacterized protein n=1 Tax=Knufia fluminis TaxID=191047 RepID=A0AAN8F025_9EURO|nr:hypothetical protein OHC33_004095 [Knufia fluminis]